MKPAPPVQCQIRTPARTIAHTICIRPCDMHKHIRTPAEAHHGHSGMQSHLILQQQHVAQRPQRVTVPKGSQLCSLQLHSCSLLNQPVMAFARLSSVGVVPRAPRSSSGRTRTATQRPVLCLMFPQQTPGGLVPFWSRHEPCHWSPQSQPPKARQRRLPRGRHLPRGRRPRGRLQSLQQPLLAKGVRPCANAH